MVPTIQSVKFRLIVNTPPELRSEAKWAMENLLPAKSKEKYMRGLTYTAWKIMRKNQAGVFIEIEFLDTTASNGQALIMFILFGLDPQEVIIPAIRFFKKKWHGADTVVLPPIYDLSFETRHVCDQFITHHLDRCKEAIAKDTRWRMRTYHGVFRGSCLVRWLVQCGLASDDHEAVQYARHLLDGRLIAHINDAHHFTNSPLLYTFK